MKTHFFGNFFINQRKKKTLFPSGPLNGKARHPLRRVVAAALPVDLLAAAHLVREFVVRGADRFRSGGERAEEEPVAAAVERRRAAGEVGAVLPAALGAVAVGEGVGGQALGARAPLVLVAGVRAGVGRADVGRAVVSACVCEGEERRVKRMQVRERVER